MDNLLRGNERRRLRMTEMLFEKDDWMTISDLSKELSTSTRMLKYDLDTFKESYDDFTIITSNKGVKLEFLKNKGLKTLYNNVLEQSMSFQLLEIILFNEQYAAHEIADQLFISMSTFYRMIDHINQVTKDYGFQIETNPCRLSGDEDSIRLFFYTFIYEKYSALDWNHFLKDVEIDMPTIDSLLYFFIDLMRIELDFAYYNLFKLFIVINLIRFKQGHFSNIDTESINIYAVFSDLNRHKDAIRYFEKHLKTKVDIHLLTQVFSPFIYDSYSINYNSLLAKAEKNRQLKEDISHIEQFFITLSTDNDIPIPNIEDLIYTFHNSTHLERYDPRANYILHDRNGQFMQTIKDEFPHFYKQLYKGIIAYQKYAGLSQSRRMLNYLMYIVVSNWEQLIRDLRRKYDKINLLIVSNRHISHAHMLKDFIEYEFGTRLMIHIYQGIFLTEEILEELEYDFVLANFPLPVLSSKNCLCIENIPTFNDLTKIQQEINEVILKRNKKRSA